jgi:hypothetical protein
VHLKSDLIIRVAFGGKGLIRWGILYSCIIGKKERALLL